MRFEHEVHLLIVVETEILPLIFQMVLHKIRAVM